MTEAGTLIPRNDAFTDNEFIDISREIEKIAWFGTEVSVLEAGQTSD